MIIRSIVINLLFIASLHALVLSSATVLYEDTTYDENLTISSTSLNLNGHTLKVNGDVRVEGDDAVITMKNINDKLIVNGDITFNGRSSSGYMTEGVIEVTGNFTQLGTNNP